MIKRKSVTSPALIMARLHSAFVFARAKGTFKLHRSEISEWNIAADMRGDSSESDSDESSKNSDDEHLRLMKAGNELHTKAAELLAGNSNRQTGTTPSNLHEELMNAYF